MEIIFDVDAPPVAKPRMTHKDRFFPRKCVSQYWAWADMVWMSARRVRLFDPILDPYAGEPFPGPLKLSCHFRFAVPNSWSRNKKRLALEGKMAHSQAPDLKNLIAGVEDALNKVLWVDDAQICTYGHSSKIWAATSGATVQVAMIAPQEVLRLSQTGGKRAPTAHVRRVK